MRREQREADKHHYDRPYTVFVPEDDSDRWLLIQAIMIQLKLRLDPHKYTPSEDADPTLVPLTMYWKIGEFDYNNPERWDENGRLKIYLCRDLGGTHNQGYLHAFAWVEEGSRCPRVCWEVPELGQHGDPNECGYPFIVRWPGATPNKEPAT